MSPRLLLADRHDALLAIDQTVRIEAPDLGGMLREVRAKVRWRRGQWASSLGLGHLGRAKTANPSERGQRNTSTIVSLGVNHDFLNGFQAYLMGGAVLYGRLGLSPMSQPSNAAFTGVDSRVTRSGNWLGAGVVYTF